MLALFAKEVCGGIRKTVHAVVPHDRAGLASRVARQASMAERIYISGAHMLAHLEERLYFGIVA